MATKHGNRVYIQVLLESFRGQLFLDQAEKHNVKASALVRNIVYDYLAKTLDEDSYRQAVFKDEQKWQEAVDARLKGRAQTRRAKTTEECSETPDPQCGLSPDAASDVDKNSAVYLTYEG